MNLFTKVKNKFNEQRARFRDLYHYNDELFHLAVKRYELAVYERKRKTQLKALNLLVNSYGAKMFRRIYGYPFHQDKKKLVSCESNLHPFFDAQLSKVEVVTFDIFDTLLIRKVSIPTDVFRAIECVDPTREGFMDERILAEKRARHLFGPEVSIDEIYSVISPKFRDLLDVELNFEQRLLERNEVAYELYCRALKAGCRVAAISDMYLPPAFIKARLIEVGYTELENVFVSCEYRISKCLNGELFTHVVNSMQVEPAKILHVGDNIHSDFAMSKKRGLQAIHFPTIRQIFASSKLNKFRVPDDGSLARSIHNALIQTYRPNSNYFQTLGFMLGGPLALGYLTWLAKELTLSRADCALFVARDGWLLRELFETYFNHNKIRTGYIYLNRLLGLKAFTTYLDEPHYLKILLNRANKEIGTPLPTDDYKKNLKIFTEYQVKLSEWGNKLKNCLIEHGHTEADGAHKIVTIDMGTGRFASLNFAKRIFDTRLINSLYFMTVNNYREKLTYQAFLPYVATSRDINVINTNLNNEINIMELMEILISSPEPRIIDLQEGSAVFDGEKDSKPFYYDISEGIHQYFRLFFNAFEPNSDNTFTADDWLVYARTFSQDLTEDDVRELSTIEFCASADNETNPHTPFKINS